MANLIITIISIALVAITVLVGAFYGGSAFSNYQAKAQATQIISDVDQVASAWRLYAINNANNYYLPHAGDALGYGTESDLVPQYLTSWISYPFTGGSSVGEKSIRFGVFDGTGLRIYVSSTVLPNLLLVAGMPMEVCQQINKIVTNSTTIPNIIDYYSSSATTNTLPLLNPSMCTSGNGTYYYFYKVF